jgi:putative spermidine/putrescine transport system ATP-binding protein
LYLAPSSPEVAAFVGMSSLVPATVADDQALIWGGRVPVAGPVADGPCEAFVRPEHVRIAAAGESGVDAVVQTSAFLGAARRTLLATSDGDQVLMQHPAALRLERGTRVRLTLEPQPVVVRARSEVGSPGPVSPA